MTVMFFSRIVPRPLRAAVTGHAGPRRRPGRRTYHDPFFADPDHVEDDSRRMRVRTAEQLTETRWRH
jgi:hypothetical protein